MKTNNVPLVGIATTTGARPADFPIGSPRSRAAARNLAEAHGIRAMQDWPSVTFDNLADAKAFARKLQSPDLANPPKVRLIVHAEAARKRVQPDGRKVSLTIGDEEVALRLARLLTQRSEGIVVYANVSVARERA